MHGPTMKDADATAAGFVSRYYRSFDGLKLHYRDYPGPADASLTVLCMPGLTRNARDYETLAPHLAARCRVLVAEFRGRGLSAYASDPRSYVVPSYARDMGALLKAAHVRQAALIGTSLGGLTATVMASLMPAKIVGIVLNDIGPEIDKAGLTRIAGYLGKGITVKTWDEAAAVIQSMDGIIYPEYRHDDWVRLAKRRYVATPDGALRPDYDFNIARATAKTPDLWPFFARLDAIPTLALRGSLSDLLTAETFAGMGRIAPTMRLVEVPNRGHAPYLDEPVAVAAIDDFLAGLPRKVGTFAAVKRTLSAAVFLAKMKIAGVI
jgi:pimeloyl-ACP methyl ester carboxylesterase